MTQRKGRNAQQKRTEQPCDRGRACRRAHLTRYASHPSVRNASRRWRPARLSIESKADDVNDRKMVVAWTTLGETSGRTQPLLVKTYRLGEIATPLASNIKPFTDGTAIKRRIRSFMPPKSPFSRPVFSPNPSFLTTKTDKCVFLSPYSPFLTRRPPQSHKQHDVSGRTWGLPRISRRQQPVSIRRLTSPRKLGRNLDPCCSLCPCT